jgi:hypothetical protein
VDILCCIHIFCPQKTQRHAVLSWYMYSGEPPSCNSCYVCTVMRIPIVVRQCCPYGQHFFVDILCFHIFCPQKTQRHAVLSWYMYSGAPPSCNSCYVCTVICILMVVRHNKTRKCCYLAVTISRT